MTLCSVWSYDGDLHFATGLVCFSGRAPFKTFTQQSWGRFAKHIYQKRTPIGLGTSSRATATADA